MRRPDNSALLSYGRRFDALLSFGAPPGAKFTEGQTDHHKNQELKTVVLSAGRQGSKDAVGRGGNYPTGGTSGQDQKTLHYVLAR